MPADAPACPACGVAVAPLPDPYGSPRDSSGPPTGPYGPPQPSYDSVGQDPFGSGPPPEPASKPPPQPSRRATWLLLLVLIGCYLAVAGDSWTRSAPESVLRDCGLLQRAALSHPGTDGWRLIHAGLIHHNPIVLMVTCFLVLRCAGEVERRAGPGTMLFVYVAGGALLNALRLEFEAEPAWLVLAGGWPAGCLLGGMALVAAFRAGRGWLGVGLTLAIDLTILAMLAESSLPEGSTAAAFRTAGAGLVLGGVLGATLPLDRGRARDSALPGWLLGVLTLCLIGGAEAMRPSLGSRPRPSTGGSTVDPLTGQTVPAPSALELRSQPHLGLDLELPSGWTAQEPPGTEDCEACGERAGPAELDDRYVVCECGERVKVGQLRRARYVESGVWMTAPKRLDVWSWPRQPFDAPDTLAGRRLAEVAQGEIAFREPILLQDRAFEGALGLGHQVVLRVKLENQGDQTFLFRLYVFVGEARTAYLSALVQEPVDYEQRLADAALFDAIARSVRERE